MLFLNCIHIPLLCCKYIGASTISLQSATDKKFQLTPPINWSSRVSIILELDWYRGYIAYCPGKGAWPLHEWNSYCCVKYCYLCRDRSFFILDFLRPSSHRCCKPGLHHIRLGTSHDRIIAAWHMYPNVRGKGCGLVSLPSCQFCFCFYFNFQGSIYFCMEENLVLLAPVIYGTVSLRN